MNAKYKNLYQEIVSRDMTDLDENSFYNEYSQNDNKFSELYSYLDSNELTDLDPETFKLEYFGTPIIKKKSQVESTESDSEVGSSDRLSTTTTRPSASSTSGKTETFTGYPGKEKNKYDFKESDGVAHWYEPNPKKDKALTELNSMRNAPPKPGPTGQGSMPAFSPEEIKRKELQYNKIPSKKIIEDDARVRALNKQFGKNASLDPIDQVYTNYDEEKKDNEYRVKDNNWQRKVPGASSWTTVTNEGSVNALNRRYGKEVKYKAELKSVKPEPKLNFADVNTSLVSKTEEDAVGTLSKKYGKYGFTFEQSGYGTDYVIAYNKDKTKEITVGFDEANPEEALKLKSFLEQNASKEKSNAALELEKKIKSLNSTHTSPGAKGYDILDRTNTLKYVLSDEYKTKFSSLSFDEMEDQINNYIKTSFQKSEDLDKFWGSDAYKIFKEKKKEEFGARDERIDLLYTELQSAKSSGNKSDVKNINSKINTYLSEDVIQDQVKNYSIQLNDLDKSAKILASDQKKYSQSVEDFNKLSESGKMNQEEFDLAKKNLEDQAEKLGTRADFLMSSGKSIQNDQKKLNVVAGKYFTKKEKAGSFGGGIVNSILTGISKSIIEVPSTFVILLTESSGSEYFKLSPEEKQYYKDKGYSKDQTINLLVNNKIKDFKAETRKNLIDVLGADQTTQEYMKSADRGLFAKSIFGVAESTPAMLMGFGGSVASFTGLASQAFSSIEDLMLSDSDFETSSASDRAVVAVPYAILMGVLENFGLKNVVKGSSFTGGIVKDILINSIKQMPKNSTKEALESIMGNEIKTLIGKGAFKIVNGAIAEGETGATQSLVLDVGLKALYNEISQSGMTEEQISNLSGGEMFTTPDTIGEITSTVLEDGLAEAIGGATMSTFTTVASGLKNGNISLYNEDDLNYLKEISQDTEFKKIIIANLKTEMLKGNLTKSEAQERLDAMNELSSVIQSIPDGLSDKDQISAVNTLSEKNRLTKEIQGKDPALVTAQTDRINEINEELKNISKNATKEDNIKQQEGTAEGGISEYQGTGEGQQEVGVSQGGQREATINEADRSDSSIPSKVQQEEQVATYREQEQAELLKAIPKIESYKVNGKIDKTIMPKTILAKYNSIYNKYDNLISPLLETTAEVVIDKPVITTNTTAEVNRVKSLTPDSEDGATFNIDGTKYEGVGLVVPVDSMNTTTEELTPEMVADFVAERQEMIGDAGVVKAGIYKFPNSNQVSIDLSVVVPETSREQALEFARLAGQESLFDLATFENIKTGATGENPMSFSPEQHREISKALKEGRIPNVFGTTAKTTNNLLTKENIKEVETKQTTPKNKLIVKAAKMVLNAIPGVKIYMHNNGQEMASAIEASKKQLTKEEKTGLTESSGLYVDGDIHINLESATIGTVYHEAFHALIEKNGMKSGSILLMAKGLKNIISDKGIKQRLDDFVSQYNEDEKAEEYISELGGILSEAEQELTTTKLQQFKTLINNIAKKLGLLVIFSASANAQDAADFINAMSKKLRTGEEIENIVTDGIQLNVVNPTGIKKQIEFKNDYKLSFVKKEDIINIEELIKNISESGQKVWFWMADQLGRGYVFDEVSGEEHYLDAGPSFALDPKNRSKRIIWASGKTAKDIQKLINNSDYIFLVSGNPETAKLFNKAVFDLYTKKLGDYNSFKKEVLSNKPRKEISEVLNAHDSWETLREDSSVDNTKTGKIGTGRKKFLMVLNDVVNKPNATLNKILKDKNAIIDINSIRDDFYADNGFKQNDIMLVLKAEKLGGKSDHSTYENDLIGDVVGVPDKKINAYDILSDEDKARYKDASNSDRNKQQAITAPYGSGIRNVQPSKIKFRKNKTDKLTAPVAGNKLFNEPLKQALDIAKSYMKSIGMEYTPVEKITKLDEGLSKRISDAYDEMKDDPTDPEVKAAYEVMAKETLDQYDAITAKGYKLEINNNEPYSSSEDMINDLRDNNRMKIFSTESGFGEEPITDKQREENILLKDSGRKDANGETLLVNDVFRFVHDFFGHAKLGNSFGPIGEENAWRVHSEMYSPEAKKAMTSETRGQNSWVNFSGVNDAAFKKREKARQLRKEGKIDQANQMVGEVYDEMKFADQKIGLLPSFAVEEGAPSKIKKQLTTDKKINPGYEAALKELGETKEQREAWRKNNKVNQKQKRNPIVEQAVKDYYNEKINQEQYLEIVAKNQPIKPFKEVPTLPSLEDITNSLDISKVATGIIGLTKNLEDGEKVASRLDIPAYEDYDTWVVSLHDGNKEGKSIAYGQTAVLKNVDFKTFPGSAVRIAMGTQNKSTIGRMFGDWVNEDPKAVHARAKELMNDPAWTQVGMNPFRYSWFYDKSDGMPVASADEVIQVGALVLAKNAKKVLPSDPIFETKSAKGGKIKFQKTAPNGKPSNLNDVQWELVRTPAFKKWFGDWENDPQNASKVVDENGEPLVVYHGTEKGNIIDQFYKRGNAGIHFGTKKSAIERREQTDFEFEGEYNLIPVFLYVKNPIKTNKDFNWEWEGMEDNNDENFNLEEDTENDLFESYMHQKGYNIYAKNGLKSLEELLSENAFDGVFYKNQIEDKGSISYVVTEPNQIKLADGTNTTFDATQPSIKFQKTTQETRMDTEAEAIFKKSLDRGVAWNTAIQNVIDYIQISKWYEDASDIDREQKIRDFRQSKKQKLKKAPSVAKIMGTPKPSTVTVTEKTALKDQIRLEARAAREAKGDLNQKRKLLSTAIKGLVKLGRLTAKQAATIINRVSVVNLDNQVMVNRLADYAAKVFEKADYQERLSRAFSFRKGIRRLLKGDIQAEVVGMAKKFSKIDPSMVDDIEKYLEMAEIVKNAIKPSRVNRKELDVNMRESMNIDSVSEFTNDAIENQERILKEELLAVHSELVDAGVIDDKMSLSDIELIINSLKEEADDADYEADILTFLSRRIDTMSAIIKDILTYKINPMTGEDVALTEKNIDIISRMLNIDINNVSIKEAIFIAEAMDNFINNNITSSVEAVIEKQEGETELENLIDDKVVASPLRKYFSPKAGQYMSEQIASMPILFEKLFVGAKNGLMVAKKMGWTALINGVNKAEKMFNTTVDVYFKQYSKTKPNSKSFNDAENVYERGMLAFLSRNVSGTVTQQAEELKRRVEVLKESVKSLLEGSSKEQKMGELYQKIYDKLNVESGDIDVIRANVDKINRSAVGWWINQWGTTYNDLSDISLSVYNTMLSSDTSYSTDRYKLLDKANLEEIIEPKNIGAFGRDIEFLDKNKTGVLMESNRPSASKVSKANRYISLDFDVNNSSSYKAALIDVNTAAAIRRIDGFINSKNFNKLIPTKEDRDIFRKRISEYIQAAKNKRVEPSDTMRLLDQLTNFLGGIGVAKALGGIDQVVKQTFPIALSTIVNSGRFDLVMPGSSASVWIDSLGMAISNRGQESQSTIESVDRRLEKAAGLIDKSANAFVDVQQFWLKYFLSKPDVFIAKSSFISYYKQYLSNNNQSTDIDWATHNVNQDAADYAMLMVDRQQNVSDTKMAGKIFSSQNSTTKIMRKIFLPFASFSLNQKSRMVSDIKVLGINSGASKQDKIIALRSLASLPFEMALYQSMSLAIRLGYLAIAKGIIGAVADDDDEEKEKLLGMEVSKEMKNATKYPLRSMITDFLSPAPIFDHLVVGGANALLSQSEDKEMINDAVDKKNLMLKVLGKDKMDEDQKEKFIKKFKKDHEYQLFNDEKKSYGTIGIGMDLYKEIMDNAKTAYTGQYTDDYMGNESERFLLPKDQENIQNAVIFDALFALGIVPRDINTVTKNMIKLSKKNSLTETQFEKYKAVGKETGGKVTGWKMDLVKSKSKTESTLEELEWIKGYGGLTEKQGQEYIKLSKLVDEVSYMQLMDLQSGMTADKIIKSY